MAYYYGSADLFFETLDKMGCEYEVYKNQLYKFSWHDEVFVVELDNESSYATMWYPAWAVFDYEYEDTLWVVKNLINDLNMKNAMTIFYVINKKDHHFYLHTKTHFLLTRGTIDPQTYLEEILDEFLAIQHMFTAQLEVAQSAPDFSIYKISEN